jgi:hypothetical protein
MKRYTITFAVLFANGSTSSLFSESVELDEKMADSLRIDQQNSGGAYFSEWIGRNLYYKFAGVYPGITDWRITQPSIAY